MEDDYILIKKKKEEEEEKKKKRGFFLLFGERFRAGRLLFLLLAFLFTLVGLSASTYAWFTSNFTVRVQDIDVNVSSGAGIQISTNAVDWKSLITITDITENKYSAAVNQVPTLSDQLNPVSTVHTAYAGATTPTQGLKMYKGTIVNDTETGTMCLTSEEQVDGSNRNYVAFDLFIKLDFSTNKRVYLTPTTGITGITGSDTQIQYAGRMAFVVNGHGESSQTAASLQQINGATNVVFYEPNYDVHTPTGLTNGQNNYGVGVNDRALTGNQTPLQYYGVKNSFAYTTGDSSTCITLNSHDTNKFEVVTPDIITTLNNNQKTFFLQLSPGVTKMRVYMWIEGQDIDCENNASGGQIKFSLGFTVDEVESTAATATSDNP